MNQMVRHDATRCTGQALDDFTWLPEKDRPGLPSPGQARPAPMDPNRTGPASATGVPRARSLTWQTHLRQRAAGRSPPVSCLPKVVRAGCHLVASVLAAYRSNSRAPSESIWYSWLVSTAVFRILEPVRPGSVPFPLASCGTKEPGWPSPSRSSPTRGFPVKLPGSLQAKRDRAVVGRAGNQVTDCRTSFAGVWVLLQEALGNRVLLRQAVPPFLSGFPYGISLEKRRSFPSDTLQGDLVTLGSETFSLSR